MEILILAAIAAAVAYVALNKGTTPSPGGSEHQPTGPADGPAPAKYNECYDEAMPRTLRWQLATMLDQADVGAATKPALLAAADAAKLTGYPKAAACLYAAADKQAQVNALGPGGPMTTVSVSPLSTLMQATSLALGNAAGLMKQKTVSAGKIGATAQAAPGDPTADPKFLAAQAKNLTDTCLSEVPPYEQPQVLQRLQDAFNHKISSGEATNYASWAYQFGWNKAGNCFMQAATQIQIAEQQAATKAAQDAKFKQAGF